MLRLFISLLLLTPLLSACTVQAPTAAPQLTHTLAPTRPVDPTITTPAASVTPRPSLTPTFTASPTPTPDPMTIAALRARSYPGSDISIEKALDPGSNYQRYYASYLSDGLKIYGLLTVPDGKPPAGGWPAIIFNHGYIPPEVYRTTERYVAYVDWLARSGYIVYKIDYRGHDQSAGLALGAYGDPGYTIDVLNAVTSMRRYPQANPDKIGMWGHSMGGFLTLRAMIISPDIKAGVIWSGVVASYTDMLTGWHHPDLATPTPIPGARRWRSNWIEQHGTPEQNPAFWESVSANTYLKDISGPLQLHASTTDEEVPYQFSQTLDQQMQSAGMPVEFYTYTSDNHNLSKSFAAAMTRTIAFYDKYLK